MIGLLLPPLFLFLAAPKGLCAENPHVWARSLRDLGLSEGMTQNGRSGVLTLYWAVPEAARKGRAALTLDLITLLPDDWSGTARLLLDGLPVAGANLRPGRAALDFEAAVPAAALADGVLRADIQWTAGSPTHVCGAPSLTVAPQSRLAIETGTPRTPQEALALLPPVVPAALPPGPLDKRAYRTILLFATALERAGHRVDFSAGAPPVLRFSAAAAALGLENGTLVVPAGAPIFSQGPSARPAPAMRAVPDMRMVPLGAFGLSSAIQPDAASTQWRFDVPLADLPQGLIPKALDVTLMTPADPAGARQILHFWVNHQLVASRMLGGAGLQRVSFAIPPGALQARNAMRLTFARVGIDDLCAPVTALPVSLLPESSMTLGPAPAPRQFFELQYLTADTVTLWLDRGALESPARSLPAALALTRHTLRADQTLAIEIAGQAPPRFDGPFLYLSDTEPAGAAIPRDAPLMSPDPLRPGPLALGADVTFARWVAARGGPGVWLHPGIASGAARLSVERGDVALLQADGTTLWLNSRTAHAIALSSLGGHLGDVVRRYWPWTALLAWLTLTLLTLLALARQRDKT